MLHCTDEAQLGRNSCSLHYNPFGFMHEVAEKAERYHQRSKIDGGIAATFEKQWEAEVEAIVYCLAHKGIPHTTKYNPLMNLRSHLGLPHLEVLKAGNANYTSYRIVDKLLSILGDEVKRLVQVQVQHPLFVGLICDETTDLSTSKALVLYAKVTVNDSMQTYFLGVSFRTALLKQLLNQ